MLILIYLTTAFICYNIYGVMSEKELDYTAFDPADCRMPEQVYACREIEGGKHKYYQIGMKILYKPVLVKYTHFCPEKLKHLSEK